MDFKSLIEILHHQEHLTDLQRDIFNTWNELQKSPIDRNSAINQITQNNAKYPYIYVAIAALPTTVNRTSDKLTEQDIRYNLKNQLSLLVPKGWEELARGK